MLSLLLHRTLGNFYIELSNLIPVRLYEIVCKYPILYFEIIERSHAIVRNHSDSTSSDPSFPAVISCKTIVPCHNQDIDPTHVMQNKLSPQKSLILPFYSHTSLPPLSTSPALTPRMFSLSALPSHSFPH